MGDLRARLHLPQRERESYRLAKYVTGKGILIMSQIQWVIKEVSVPKARSRV
jgi:hypothetical protein